MISNNVSFNQKIFSFQVSGAERDSSVQELIDESYQINVLPQHKAIFNGNGLYTCTGRRDYDLSGTRASEIAEEFAYKEKFSILDLGTGNGMFLKAMKERFGNVDIMGVSAADFRPTIFGKKNENIPDEEYSVANIENLSKIPSLYGRKFDLIVSAKTFMHLSDPFGTLCQAYEMLEPNGVLIVDEFDLNGIPETEYEKLFNGYKVEIWPDNISQLISRKAVVTKIRKTVEHLLLPIVYDLEKSTHANVNQQAHIFYKLA